MKKSCALLLVLTMLFGLCACGKTPDEPPTDPDADDTTAPVVTETDAAPHLVVLP